MTSRLLTFADRWRLGAILACATLFALALPFTDLRLEWDTFLPIYLMAAFLTAVGMAYRLLDRDESIAATVFIVAQIIVYSNLAVLNNYAGLELRRPLNDEFLAGVDRAIGLDWWAYINWLKSNPFVGRALSAAYMSSLPQVAVAIIVLGFTRRFERLDRFSLAFMYSSALTIAIWTAFPSFGALALHYSKGLADPGFDLVVTKEEALKLLALHAGPTPTLKLPELLGMIACPSFHTVLAMLTIYALWGVAYVGPLAIMLNIVVIASIPADGGHHFVDVAAGVAATGVALYMAELTMRRRASLEARAASAPATLSPPAAA